MRDIACAEVLDCCNQRRVRDIVCAEVLDCCNQRRVRDIVCAESAGLLQKGCAILSTRSVLDCCNQSGGARY